MEESMRDVGNLIAGLQDFHTTYAFYQVLWVQQSQPMEFTFLRFSSPSSCNRKVGCEPTPYHTI